MCSDTCAKSVVIFGPSNYYHGGHERYHFFLCYAHLLYLNKEFAFSTINSVQQVLYRNVLVGACQSYTVVICCAGKKALTGVATRSKIKLRRKQDVAPMMLVESPLVS